MNQKIGERCVMKIYYEGTILMDKVADNFDVTDLYLGFFLNHDLSPLNTMTQLRTLSLKNITISELCSLSNLCNLQNLELDYLNVPNYYALTYFKGLTTLKITNSFSNDNIESISHLTKLTSLDISDNLLKDISFLSTLSSLKKLIIKNNNIHNVNIIGTIHTLTYIDVSNNQIENIDVLKKLPLLIFFDFSNNNIINHSKNKNIKSICIIM